MSCKNVVVAEVILILVTELEIPAILWFHIRVPCLVGVFVHDEHKGIQLLKRGRSTRRPAVNVKLLEESACQVIKPEGRIHHIYG